jgi:hypothetical protein
MPAVPYLKVSSGVKGPEVACCRNEQLTPQSCALLKSSRPWQDEHLVFTRRSVHSAETDARRLGRVGTVRWKLAALGGFRPGIS